MSRISIFLILLTITACSDSSKEITYYENGKIRFEVPIEKGERNGLLNQYYEDGSLQLQSEWRNGIKHGFVKSYYPNGKLKSLEYSVNGKGEGLFKYYDSLGKLEQLMEYLDSKQHGEYFSFYSDSTINIKAVFKDGVRHGKAEMYYPNGTLQRRMIYENGELVYSVDYTDNGGFFNPFLSIEVTQNKLTKADFNISLQHSFYDSSRIGVIVGDLDEKGRLLDTLKVLGSNVGDLKVEYELPEDYNKDYVSGVLFEMDYSKENDGRIMSQYPFTHEIK